MLTHDVLETQATIELPAREMMGWNFSAIFANQTAVNYNTQVNAVGVGQANLSSQYAVNSIEVYQS
jgi:hypothetical protein